jgi:hypothetical protein
MRSCFWLPLALSLAALPAAAHAEKLPRPSVDYAAEGNLMFGKGENPGTMRHSGGKMRLDTDVEGQPSSVYIDLMAKTATVVMERLGQKIAMHIDPERAAAAASLLDEDAKRVGEAAIAGETCNDYEFETAKGRAMRACITDDGIVLRTRDVSRNRVLWLASRVTRAAQDPGLFVLPADAIPLQIPKLR